MTTLTFVEDHILARVAATFAAGQLNAVESLPAAMNSTMIKQLAPRAPGVFLSFIGAAPMRGSSPRQFQVRWALYVLTTHASGQAARRRGDAVAIGAYEILPSLVQALVDTPIVDCGAVSNVRIENLWSGDLEKRGIALFGVSFEFPMELSGQAAALNDFLTFHVDYDIPPFVSTGEHEKWLQEPPDYTNSAPDASDHITLAP